MKVAIIGAGLAGLATAYFILESKKASVTLFEADSVGAGASGASGGLLHPYPGFAARRSSKASDAITVTKKLLRIAEAHTPRIVATHQGILRKSMDPEQKERLIKHSRQWGDVERIGEDLFCIHSGITVHPRNYLEGLSHCVMQMGADIRIQMIRSLTELDAFDHIVIAAGFGVRAFVECQHLPIRFIKGQVLHLKGVFSLERSFISKGYIAQLEGEHTFDLGATYEREFDDERPDIERAKHLLQDKLAYCPNIEILSCKAGVRVARSNHYYPIVEKVAPNAHVFTALGSRGLLYHGLYGRELARAILLV